MTGRFRESATAADVATDDWPLFYMRQRTYPVTYMMMLLVLLGLSGWLVKRNLGTPLVPGRASGVFLFLGAGFMLVETKSITELGLTFGK